jgi:triphosphatase
MAVETELKLRIASEQLARLKRHALLKAHTVSRPVTRRLYNIYYDTPKLQLHGSGMALRLRHAGRQWLQTLKGGGSVQAGLHRRDEWEVPVNGPALELSGLSADWDEHLPRSLRKRLRPVFVTDFSRSSRMLDFHGAGIELCIDQGEIGAEQRSIPVCELELELKSGEPRQLFELALALLEIVPFELEIVSKAEQGYRLLSGYAQHPVKDVAPVVARTDALDDVLQALIWSCLQHFQGNLSGAMQHRDRADDGAEYLHQMRVALRRLRVVLRITEKIRADQQLAGLYREVSELCVELGRIREWDVFIAGTLQPMCTRIGGHAGLSALLMDCERRRAAAYASLRDAAQARELQRLLLRFAIWMNGDYWRQGARGQAAAGKPEGGKPDAEKPGARDFASRRLRKLAKRFARSGQQLESADAARLHALRIVAKKLRYSAEFFSRLFDQHRTAAYVTALGEVQDVLGQINDDAVAHRLLASMSSSLAENAVPSAQLDGTEMDAINLTRGWIAHDQSAQLAALDKSLRHFNKQPEFWKY